VGNKDRPELADLPAGCRGVFGNRPQAWPKAKIDKLILVIIIAIAYNRINSADAWRGHQAVRFLFQSQGVCAMSGGGGT